ncbi:MAG: hypothetical protein E6J34_18290 [Chloroflexi bacterium]|nr:MAG: hypothetical protein E6J34_18290 [Chloroflexota bacterium]
MSFVIMRCTMCGRQTLHRCAQCQRPICTQCRLTRHGKSYCSPDHRNHDAGLARWLRRFEQPWG